MIPIGRSVIVPANGTLPNIILSPRSFFRIRDALARERFDVVHLHEPMTPTPCIATLAVCTAPMVGHVPRERRPRLDALREARLGIPRRPARPPHRGLASARSSRRERWLPGEYEIVPNGVLIPPHADPAGREHRIVFAGRHENRKGLHVLLHAWPEIRRRTGATLRVCGADPLRVRLLMTRLRVPDDGIEVLGFLPQEQFTEELLAAKALVAPSLGGESFGIVLTRALACATPVVASDIPGYRDVMTPETGVAFPPGDAAALADAVAGAARRRAAAPGDGRRRPAARAGAATRGRRSRSGSSGSTSRRDRCRMKLSRLRLPRSNAVRFAVSLVFMAGVVALLWWRGPSFTAIADAFTTVKWEWVVVAIALNLASVVVRALAWRDRDQPGAREAAPREPARLLRVLGRALRERRAARAASASSRASRC